MKKIYIISLGQPYQTNMYGQPVYTQQTTQYVTSQQYPAQYGQPYASAPVTVTQPVYQVPQPVYTPPVYASQPVVYASQAQPVLAVPAPQPVMVPQGPGIVMNMSSRKIALYNTHHRKYLFAGHGSLYTHNHLDHGHWFGSQNHHGHFHMETSGTGRAHLRCHHGKYIAIDYNGHIHLTHHKHEIDCLFTIEYHAEHSGKLGFRGNGGRYLGIANFGHVKATHYFNHDELWEVVNL